MAVAQWVGATTNQTTVLAVGWALERRLIRAERVGADFYSSLWVANGAKKKKKREGDGALDFDGVCWMGGHNTQPKSSRNIGL
jgi:hypothetical protein